MKHLNKLNFALVAITASGVLYMFDTFASNERVDSLELSIWYGQYYDRLDDRDEAVDEGNQALAEEYERQMEKWRAKICKADSEWERC